MTAPVERPDLKKLKAEFNASQYQYRTPDGYQLVRVIDYAVALERELEAAREALEKAAYNHHLGMGCKSPTGMAKDCVNPVCRQNFAALAALARGGGT